MNFLKKFILLFSLVINSYFCKAEYFQQDVRYTIHVSLNDTKHVLSGFETVIYTNNSPSILKEIYFHIWPNAYKDNSTILAKEIFQSGDDRMLAAKQEDLGMIDSLDFKINDESVQWFFLKDTIDICKIILNKALNPGDSITISTPFHVKIPSAFLSRLGHNKQAYFITQWYPKPAVFDSNGWNYFPYLDQGEYYSEFGSFDVYITLPENYFIAATGLMVNADQEYLRLLKKDSITRCTRIFSYSDSTPASSKIFKTIHFHQDKVHDFAWFADKRWHVLMDSVILADNKKKITTWSFFNNREAAFWLKAPEFINDAVQYYSKWVGDYPYEQLTVLDVGAAMGNTMEYPMISTIGNYGNQFELELAIVHEIGHNWFYGILGNNERYQPSLDEGINNFYETRYVYTKYKNDLSYQRQIKNISVLKKINIDVLINHRKFQYLNYLSRARMNLDQSPDIYSNKIRVPDYHSAVYYKPSISFDYLKSFLGDSVFDNCMKSYFNEWKYKHPHLDDIKLVFEKNSKKNLNWFFTDLMGSTKKLDYKITKTHLSDTNYVELEIKNTGNINGPITLNEMKSNNIISTQWIDGFPGKIKISLPCNDCDKYKIDAEEKMPEFYQDDNTIKMKGVFRKTEKIKLSFGMNPEDASKTYISYLPVAGWNNYNQIMIGTILHNISFCEKKIEYKIMPLYAFGTRDIEGGGDVSYHIYPKNNNIYRITIGTGISRYAFGKDEYTRPSDAFHYSGILHFTKINTKIIFSHKHKNSQDHFSSNLTFRNILINRDIPYSYNSKKQNVNILYWQAAFERKNTNPLIYSTQKYNITTGNKMMIAKGEMTNYINYGEAKKGFNIRIFGGYLSIPALSPYQIDSRISLSGKSGKDDNLFDEIFLGRTEENGILSHQFVNDYAGFKTPTSFYRIAEKWMFGFNVNTTLPGLLPFRLFANTGVFDNSDNSGEYGKISWEIGVDLPIIKDIFVIYFPFAYSKDIKDAVDRQKLHAGDLIRFELNFNMLNPFDNIKRSITE